ncbi:hypothetical protein [Streptomyces sp. SD15]
MPTQFMDVKEIAEYVTVRRINWILLPLIGRLAEMMLRQRSGH